MMRWIAIGLLFLVSVSSMILFFLIALSPLPELQQQQDERLATLATLRVPMTKVLLLQERMDTISGLLAKRNDVDKTIQSVLSKLPTDVSVTSIALKENNLEVTVTSQSLSSIDLFLNTMVTASEENNEFSMVILKDVSRDDQSQNFSSTISVTVL